MAKKEAPLGELIDAFGPPVHVAGGAVALAAVPVAIGSEKGGLWHRRAGRTFFWGMTAVFLTAMALGLHGNDELMVLVGVFGYYLVVSGYRALYLKGPAKAVGAVYRAGPIDQGAAQFTMVTCAILFAWGLASISSNPMAPVLIMWGALGVGLALSDLRRFRRIPIRPETWFFGHAVRMMAGAMAAATAIVVVNFPDLPPYIQWFVPTIIGSIGIIAVVTVWRRRLADGTHLEDLVEIRILDPDKEAS